jgi:CRISPR-associated protein Cas2
MVVVSLVDCPATLRGDLTKWLLEISAGVFVGRISARVRDNVWKRIEKYAKNGRATMVYSAANEQGFAFKTLGSGWEPIDFDGMHLILRPSLSRVRHLAARRSPGYSKASRYRMARRSAGMSVYDGEKQTACYIVIDIETTGISPERSEILKLAAIKIESGAIAESFTALIRTDVPVSPPIESLTGITNAMLAEQGEFLPDALAYFLAFVGDMTLVAHDARSDMAFILAACRRYNMAAPENEIIDTLALARAKLSGVRQYTLAALSEHFGFEAANAHRGSAECILAWQLYEKLSNLQ